MAKPKSYTMEDPLVKLKKTISKKPTQEEQVRGNALKRYLATYAPKRDQSMPTSVEIDFNQFPDKN